MEKNDILLTLFIGTCVSAAIVGVRYVYYKYKVAEQSDIVSAQKNELLRKYNADLEAFLDIDNKPLFYNANTVAPNIVTQDSNIYSSQTLYPHTVADSSFLKILCDNDQACINAQLLLEKFNESLCHVHTETIYPLMFAAAYCVFNQFTADSDSYGSGKDKNNYKKRYDNLRDIVYADRLKTANNFNCLRANVTQVIAEAVDAQMKVIFSTPEFKKRLDKIATSQYSADKKNRLELDYIIQQGNIVFDQYMATFEKSAEDV